MHSYSTYVYKIMEAAGARRRTVVHGWHGSRTLPLDEWLDADIKSVTNGTGGEAYVSGWHALPSRKMALACIDTFRVRRNRLVIVGCWGTGVRPKPRARFDTVLCDRLFITDTLYCRKCGRILRLTRKFCAYSYYTCRGCKRRFVLDARGLMCEG